MREKMYTVFSFRNGESKLYGIVERDKDECCFIDFLNWQASPEQGAKGDEEYSGTYDTLEEAEAIAEMHRKFEKLCS